MVTYSLLIATFINWNKFIVLELRIRLKNFKILGNGRELYINPDTTRSCVDSYNPGTRPVPSICDDVLNISVVSVENISNITILVNAHTNDNQYPTNGSLASDNKRAILTLCEVQIFASKFNTMNPYTGTICLTTFSLYLTSVLFASGVSHTTKTTHIQLCLKGQCTTFFCSASFSKYIGLFSNYVYLFCPQQFYVIC